MWPLLLPFLIVFPFLPFLFPFPPGIPTCTVISWHFLGRRAMSGAIAPVGAAFGKELSRSAIVALILCKRDGSFEWCLSSVLRILLRDFALKGKTPVRCRNQLFLAWALLRRALLLNVKIDGAIFAKIEHDSEDQ